MSRNLGNTYTYTKISLTLTGGRERTLCHSSSSPLLQSGSLGSCLVQTACRPQPISISWGSCLALVYTQFSSFLWTLSGLFLCQPQIPGNTFCLGPPVATGAMDSAITRDASSCSKWELIQRPQLDNLQRVGGLRTFSPKCVVSIEPLPLGSGSCEEEEAERF